MKHTKPCRRRVYERRYADIREFLDSLKSVPCKDCDAKHSPWVMHFDHVRGEKKFNLAHATTMWGNLRPTWEHAILEEAAKCDVVCANCHAERTHQRLTQHLGMPQIGVEN